MTMKLEHVVTIGDALEFLVTCELMALEMDEKWVPWLQNQELNRILRKRIDAQITPKVEYLRVLQARTNQPDNQEACMTLVKEMQAIAKAAVADSLKMITAQ